MVTGNMRRRMGTPEGVNFVYNKQKDRVLRGPGYASPVKIAGYPCKGQHRIHDAAEKEFGGDILPELPVPMAVSIHRRTKWKNCTTWYRSVPLS